MFKIFLHPLARLIPLLTIIFVLVASIYYKDKQPLPYWMHIVAFGIIAVFNICIIIAKYKAGQVNSKAKLIVASVVVLGTIGILLWFLYNK